jgi:metallothiol transferase
MIVLEGLNYFGITVSDIDRSVEYYRTMFDFEFLDRISDENQAFVKMGDEIISLIKGDGGSQVGRLSFTVDEGDFDDIIDEIEQNEYQLKSEPDEDNGILILLDPDGNEIELTIRKIG